MEQFFQLTLLGLLVGMIYALIAMGLVLIFRCSGVLNFAQGYFALVGAMLVWAFASQLGLPVWAVFILSLGGAALLGLVVERLTIRPLIGQPVFAIIAMTLGLGVVLEAIVTFVWGSEGRGYPENILLPTGTVHLGGIGLPQLQIYALVIAAAVFGGLMIYLTRSKSGLAMQAIADDTEAAESLGISVRSILSIAWVLSAVVAMVGGYLLGSIIGVEIAGLPQFGLKAIAVMLIGGLESLTGCLIAGPFVGFCEYMASGYLDPLVGGGLKDVFPYVILIIVLVIRPYGFLGWKRIERV